MHGGVETPSTLRLLELRTSLVFGGNVAGVASRTREEHHVGQIVVLPSCASAYVALNEEFAEIALHRLTRQESRNLSCGEVSDGIEIESEACQREMYGVGVCPSIRRRMQRISFPMSRGRIQPAHL
jgi:hypothetical protein